MLSPPMNGAIARGPGCLHLQSLNFIVGTTVVCSHVARAGCRCVQMCYNSGCASSGGEQPMCVILIVSVMFAPSCAFNAAERFRLYIEHMAPNKRGGPLSIPVTPVLAEGSVVSAEEVAARGSGTAEQGDSYCSDDFSKLWASECRVFFTGLMFLTRLPCPGWCDHHPAFLMRSMQHFPLIGAAIGAWAAVFFNAAAVLLPAPVAAGVSTLATVWLTGCFHEDGLADCFDGFGGGWGRSQILRIMKDSRIGTYALVGMVLVLHMKLHVLAAFPLTLVGPALVAVHCASRWSSVPLLYCCTYIQDEEDAKKGLYNWFAQSQRLLTAPRLLFGTAVAVMVPVALLGAQQAAIVCATVLLVTVCSGFYANSIIGGVVGDYLGATIQVCELACYLTLSADWATLADGRESWQPLLLLVCTVALPVIYTRRIVDFGTKDC